RRREYRHSCAFDARECCVARAADALNPPCPGALVPRAGELALAAGAAGGLVSGVEPVAHGAATGPYRWVGTRGEAEPFEVWHAAHRHLSGRAPSGQAAPVVGLDGDLPLPHPPHRSKLAHMFGTRCRARCRLSPAEGVTVVL